MHPKIEGKIASFSPKFVDVSTKVKIEGENITILEGKGKLWEADIKIFR